MPSLGICRRIHSDSPASGSVNLLTTYKSYSYMRWSRSSSVSSSSSFFFFFADGSPRLYTPPFLPRKYGNGYSGISTVISSSNVALRMTMMLSSAFASAICAPICMGEVIVPLLGQSAHPSGYKPPNVAHLYGLPIKDCALSCVSFGSYSS